jgi:hypothetical protein
MCHHSSRFSNHRKCLNVRRRRADLKGKHVTPCNCRFPNFKMRSSESRTFSVPSALGCPTPRRVPGPSPGVARSDVALAQRASVNCHGSHPSRPELARRRALSGWADGGKGARGNLPLARAFRAEPQAGGPAGPRIYQARLHSAVGSGWVRGPLRDPQLALGPAQAGGDWARRHGANAPGPTSGGGGRPTTSMLAPKVPTSGGGGKGDVARPPSQGP